MDRLKAPLRIANTLALFLFVYAMLVNPSSAAPSAGPLAAPLSPGFEYEGRLGTLTGKYDMKFQLYNAATGGTLAYNVTAAAAAVPVANGDYRTVLRFGEGITSVLAGEALYVEVFYRVATTNANAPYTVQTGARAQLMPQAYAMSLRPGARVRGNVSGAGLFVTNTGSGTGIAGQSNGGAGVTGQSTSWLGVYGLSESQAGVRGDSTSSTGVAGQSVSGTGTTGQSTNGTGMSGVSQTRAGVSGRSTSGAGVYGESSSWIGVHGVSQTQSGVTGKSSTFTGVWGESTSGAGVYGQSSSWLGVHGVSETQTGVLGKSTTATGVWGESRDWLGVFGLSTKQTGVAGKSTNGAGVTGESRDHYGVYGTSTKSDGVQGVTGATNFSGVAGINTSSGYGVYGTSTNGTGVYGTSANGHGIYGTVNTPNMSGVWAANTAGGNALSVSGNAAQSVSGGGMVKAMALIDPLDATDKVKQCFNSQLPGPQATSGNCGITVTMGTACKGWREIDFGFKVDDRFVSVSPLDNGNDPVTAELRPRNWSTWDVTTYYIHDRLSTCAKFFIIVY